MSFVDVGCAIDILGDQIVFDVVHTTAVLDVHGHEQKTTTTTTGVNGLVTPVGPNQLRRRDDGTRLTAAIDVRTRYALTLGWKVDDITSHEADIISWDGRMWVVAALDTYWQFGSGWVRAQCDMLDLMPVAPDTPPPAGA